MDGVISLFGFDARRPPPGCWALVDGTIHFLSSAAGPLVTRLGAGFELVWCSGWEDRADEHLPDLLGLPRGLRHLGFGPIGPAVDRHWKLAAIDAFAGERRALAWVDDGHDASCEQWAASRPGPTLLVATDPASGLTDAEATRLLDWAGALDQAGGAAVP